MSSINDKLNNVRKPRIHIKYDIETEGGTIQKELPFVVGVMGDFSGNNSSNKQTIKEKKFIQIDPDNFDTVMQKVDPGLNLRVNNTLGNSDSEELSVSLKFKSIDDFEPNNIINQVPALKELKETRDKLRDLLSKTDRSDELEKLLEAVLKDNNKINALAEELKNSDSKSDNQ